MLKESKTIQERTQRTKAFKTRSKSNKLINNSSLYIINNVTYNDYKNDIDLTENLDKLGINGRNENVITDDIYTQFATTFFKKPNEIMIPTKVKSLLERELPKHYLHKIHGGTKTKENIKVAVELCLLFLSQLSSTYRNILNGNSPEGWKSLRAEYLRQLLRIDNQTYQHVKKTLLEFQYDSGPILEERFYIVGVQSYGYRLGESFRSKGYISYELKTKKVQELFRKSCTRKLRLAEKNSICLNLIEFYKTIVLPTEKEIQDEADRLITEGYENKKGKKLIRMNKKSRTYYPDTANLSFVEDALKIFRYLTKNGLMIPRPGNEKSGGRIVDSLVLMPSWIRKLIKINGRSIVEADYSCLHPNIAMKLYNGNARYLNHENLANKLKIDIRLVKTEHLSFFNKEIWQMKQSPLFNYYQKHEPIMQDAIIKEKNESEYGHKITSLRLFSKEVELMTEVVSRLNEEGVFVGYVYDALFFDPIHAIKVKEVMGEVAAEFSVFTTAKLE
ncbi:MAG: hypothetical protein B7Y83_01295 [Flavobacteriales bacterium 32-34-25]|nr:MAG: hypothetical protein B7Y83_01295 [Flavobacteriales bacterium 32-34-25]